MECPRMTTKITENSQVDRDQYLTRIQIRSLQNKEVNVGCKREIQ